MSGKTFILLSLINWRGAFLYLCWKKRRSCLKGNWSSFVGKCIQNGSRSTSILAYDSSVILWQHWKISTLMSPFPLPPETQLNWRHMNLFKMRLHFYWVIKWVLLFWPMMLLKIPSPFIKNFYGRWCFFRCRREVFCIPLAAKQKGPTDFINTLRGCAR